MFLGQFTYPVLGLFLLLGRLAVCCWGLLRGGATGWWQGVQRRDALCRYMTCQAAGTIAYNRGHAITLGIAPLGDIVSMLAHIYPHKARRKIEVIICKITRLTAHFVWPDVWSADLHLLIKSMVIHDTECPYWDQVSLSNTNQTKPLL